MCNYGDDSGGECRVVCDTDYVVNPIRIFRRAFNCKHPDELESMITAMETQSPCLGKFHSVSDSGEQCSYRHMYLLHGEETLFSGVWNMLDTNQAVKPQITATEDGLRLQKHVQT